MILCSILENTTTIEKEKIAHVVIILHEEISECMCYQIISAKNLILDIDIRSY